jgi:hypothetical protein
MSPTLRRACRAVGITCVLGAALSYSGGVLAGSARDHLNAPIDSWFAFYNAGYAAPVTPEDGLDVTAPIRTNVLSQSLVLTRTMDFWVRTGGLSIVVPYLNAESSSGSNRGAVSGVSDVGVPWQMNIFGGPVLTREEFASFVPQTSRASTSRRIRCSSWKATLVATLPLASGCQRTPITTSAAKRASTERVRATPPTRYDWALAWARSSGVAATWC